MRISEIPRKNTALSAMKQGMAHSYSSLDHERLVLASGAVVHIWLCHSPRAILILQHGFAEYAERYLWAHSELISKLNVCGFEVWSMDLMGHGRSPGKRGIVDVQLAVDDHLRMRDQAATRKLPIFLFGHSLGGLITAASATRDSSMLDGVILSSPALPVMMVAPGERIVGLLARHMPTVRIPLPKSPMDELCQDSEQVRLAREDQSIYKGQISFLLAATSLREVKQIWARMGQWTNPTMVVHGTRDSWTKFEQSETFVLNIASKDKTLHLVEGGYHELLNDRNHEHTLDLMLEWLETRVK